MAAELDLAALRLVATPAFVLNAQGTVRLATEAAARLLGLETGDIEGRPFATLHETASVERVRNWLERNLAGREPAPECVADMRLPLAGRLPARHHACLVKRGTETLILVQTARLEIVPVASSEDPANGTGAISLLLPRSTFERQLRAILADRGRGICCLLQVDIDHFKVLTDRLGAAAGQAATELVARTLVDELPSHLVVARGGIESFLVFLDDTTLAESTRIAHSFCRSIRGTELRCSGEALHLSVSIGIVELQPGILNSSDALCSVDTAAHQARESGGNAVRSYRWDDSLIIRSTREFNELPRLQRAIETDSFVLDFQPIQALGCSTSPAGELLIRMIDEAGVLRGPGAFLPVAERYSLTSAIDRFTLRSALTWLSSHPQVLDKLAYVAINLGGQTLCDAGACDWFEQQVRTYRHCAAKLCFEITETVLIRNLRPVRGFLDRMAALGCRFALDDFGTGFSSLRYLQSLPVDFVKIDGAFVRGCDEDPRVRTMLAAINDLCHMLGKRTVAEFAEKPEILSVLRQIDVDCAQGFAVSHPFPLNELEDWLLGQERPELSQRRPARRVASAGK
jgi:diguanylate cyclase (GGDEF)-like protein